MDNYTNNFATQSFNLENDLKQEQIKVANLLTENKKLKRTINKLKMKYEIKVTKNYFDE